MPPISMLDLWFFTPVSVNIETGGGGGRVVVIISPQVKREDECMYVHFLTILASFPLWFLLHIKSRFVRRSGGILSGQSLWRTIQKI